MGNSNKAEIESLDIDKDAVLSHPKFSKAIVINKNTEPKILLSESLPNKAIY